MPLYVEMAVIVFNMADEPPLSVNRELKRQIIEILVIFDNNKREFSLEDADGVHRRLSQMWRKVFQLTQVNVFDEAILSNISGAIALLQQWEEMTADSEYRAPLQQLGRMGRPRYEISRSQLEYFLLNGFKGPDIALMLCPTLRTVLGESKRMGFSQACYIQTYLILNLTE